MTLVKGELKLVTNTPVDSISEVWVRARETRGQGDGLIVGVNDRVTVTDGAVEFTALPGAAVLVLVQNGMPIETLPMLIADEAEQSLRVAVQAAQVAGAADQRVIEQLSIEVATHASRAEQYRNEAAASASEAKTSETNAAQSSSTAGTYRDEAEAARDRSIAEADLSEDAAAVSVATAIGLGEEYKIRLTSLEAMNGVSPETPVDGQTASLIEQPETLTRSAIGGVIDEWSESVGKNIYAPSTPLSAVPADSLGVSSTDPDAGQTITAALSELPPGATLYLDGEYTAVTSIVITKPVRIIGSAKITAQHDNPLFDVQSDNVSFDGGLRLAGRQRDTYIREARGISCLGTLDNYRENLHIGDVKFDTFAGGGLVARFARNITTSEGFEVTRSKYWGVAYVSCEQVNMYRPVIRDVHQFSSSNINAYGITATHRDGDPETEPSSSDVTIVEPLIEDVPTWAGIDTHACKKFKVIRPTVRRCRWGISIVSGPGADGSEQRAPTDFLVDNAYVEDCSGYGIGVSGAGVALGEWVELATGVIRNPTIVRCGSPTGDRSGAIWLRTTQGIRISGLRAFEPGSHGIILYYNNFDFYIDDAVVVDPWSDTHTLPSVIAARSSYNQGTVESFRGVRGAKQAASVLQYGIHNSTIASTNTIRMGTACSVDTGILVYEVSAGKRVSFDTQATSISIGRWQSQMGFYGVEPVPQQTISGAATDPETTQALVNELRDKLIALGIVK